MTPRGAERCFEAKLLIPGEIRGSKVLLSRLDDYVGNRGWADFAVRTPLGSFFHFAGKERTFGCYLETTRARQIPSQVILPVPGGGWLPSGMMPRSSDFR